jgi:NTE family protein
MIENGMVKYLSFRPVISKLPVIVLLCFVSAGSIRGQTSAAKRPSVGVVLSGGGAKGLAHIGVLKVMEEIGIPVDYIAGTSMGSIIGGLYAAGYDADRLETITVGQNWNKLLSDNIPRTDLSIEEKTEEDIFFISFPYGKTGVRIPSGIISGQNIENLLNTLCFPVYRIRDFNRLQIPFLCVAMDITSGKEVLLRDGYLPDAMRASMAIPSLFAAVRRDSFLLVDGGVINNFPSDRLKEMGADILIGVDVGYQNKEPPSDFYDIFKIFEQTVFLSSEARMNANRRLCDILITPDMTGYGASSFSNADSLIARGERAARAHLPELYKLRDSLRNISGFSSKKPVLPAVDSVFLKEVQITGLEKVSSRLLTGKLQLSLQSWIKPADLHSAINNAYSSLYFSKVTYELQPVEDEKTNSQARLLIRVTEKEGGSLRVGLNYNSDFRASIILNTTFRNLLIDGTKLSVSIGLGDSPKILASYFKNNGAKPGWGLEVEGQNMDIYYYRGDRKTTTIDYTDISVRLFTQSIFKNSFAVGGGLEYDFVNLKPVVGDVLPESESDRFYNGFFFLNIDRYDDISYPTRGSSLYGVYKLIYAEELPFRHFVRFQYEKAVPIVKRITFLPSFFAGYSSADSAQSMIQFYLGGMNQLHNKGLLPFVGLDFMQINSRFFAGIGANLQVNFWRKNYAVLRINAGSSSWIHSDLFQPGTGLLGFGITLGNKSMIGPIEITLMASNVHHDLLSYFNIGYWF